MSVKGVGNLQIPQNKQIRDLFDYTGIYQFYYNLLTELQLSRIQWSFPSEPYLERQGALIALEQYLCFEGTALFFKDPANIYVDTYVIGGCAGLNLNAYGFSDEWNATLKNGLTIPNLNSDNAVQIFNSFTRNGDFVDIAMFANRLANIDLLIQQNLQQLKMPYIVKLGSQKSALTYKNLLAQVNDFKQAIFISKDIDIENDLTILPTKTEYLVDKLTQAKRDTFQQALTCMGLNSPVSKTERLIVGEEIDNNSLPNGILECILCSRKKAADDIQDKFNIPVEVDLRQDLQAKIRMIENMVLNSISTDTNEEGDDNGKIHNDTK